MNIKKHIPNLFTLGNLFCGVLASIALIQDQDYSKAVYYIIIGLVFDFLDGMLARMLKVSGELGKQLDSLADMVTFGVVPGLIAMNLIQHEEYEWLGYGGLIITLFSAIRLAKFNIDTRQTEEFIGMPTPGNTILWMSLPFVIENHNPWLILTLAVLSSFLMVSEMPLMSLKFKDLDFKKNSMRYILIGLSIGVLIFSIFILENVFMCLPIIIILYLILSILKNILIKKNAV